MSTIISGTEIITGSITGDGSNLTGDMGNIIKVTQVDDGTRMVFGLTNPDLLTAHFTKTEMSSILYIDWIIAAHDAYNGGGTYSYAIDGGARDYTKVSGNHNHTGDTWSIVQVFSLRLTGVSAGSHTITLGYGKFNGAGRPHEVQNPSSADSPEYATTGTKSSTRIMEVRN